MEMVGNFDRNVFAKSKLLSFTHWMPSQVTNAPEEHFYKKSPSKMAFYNWRNQKGNSYNYKTKNGNRKEKPREAQIRFGLADFRHLFSNKKITNACVKWVKHGTTTIYYYNLPLQSLAEPLIFCDRIFLRFRTFANKFPRKQIPVYSIWIFVLQERTTPNSKSDWGAARDSTWWWLANNATKNVCICEITRCKRLYLATCMIDTWTPTLQNMYAET